MDGTEVIAGLRGWTSVPDPGALRPLRQQRQGGGPRRRRRRLRHQAVRHGRAARPAARHDPPRAGNGEEPPVVQLRRDGRRPRRPQGHPRRGGRTADSDRVAPARGAGASPRPAAQPEAAAGRGVGSGLRDRSGQPASLHGTAAPQARGRTPRAPGTCSTNPAWATASSPTTIVRSSGTPEGARLSASGRGGTGPARVRPRTGHRARGRHAAARPTRAARRGPGARRRPRRWRRSSRPGRVR